MHVDYVYISLVIFVFPVFYFDQSSVDQLTGQLTDELTDGKVDRETMSMNTLYKLSNVCMNMYAKSFYMHENQCLQIENLLIPAFLQVLLDTCSSELAKLVLLP